MERLANLLSIIVQFLFGGIDENRTRASRPFIDMLKKFISFFPPPPPPPPPPPSLPSTPPLSLSLYSVLLSLFLLFCKKLVEILFGASIWTGATTTATTAAAAAATRKDNKARIPTVARGYLINIDVGSFLVIAARWRMGAQMKSDGKKNQMQDETEREKERWKPIMTDRKRSG